MEDMIRAVEGTKWERFGDYHGLWEEYIARVGQGGKFSSAWET